MNSGQIDNKAFVENKDTVSSALIIGLLKSARSLGLDVSQCADRVGLEGPALEDPVCRVPYGKLIALLDELCSLSNYRREIGVELGRYLIPGSFSALGYAAASCETLGEAIRVIPQYENVTLTPGKTVLAVSGERVLLSWTTIRTPYSHILEEIILSSWITLARALTSQDSLLLKVSLTGTEPEDSAVFTSLFGGDIAFKQPLATVSFPVSLLSTPIVQSDPFINNLMREQAGRIQQSLSEVSTFSHLVAETINRSMVKGELGQDLVCRQLNVGVRTLRRRLKEEGTSFKAILDNVRRENSRHYLSEKQISIFEVAMLLGYKDHSAFSAAFKRWFGLSPQAYRESPDKEKIY